MNATSLPALDLASPFLQEALWMSPRLGQALTSYMVLRYGEERIGGDEAGPQGRWGREGISIAK